MKITEKILGIIIVLSIVLKFFHIPGSSFFLVLSTSTLMMLYFYVGFAMFNGILLKEIFKKKTYDGISTLRIIGAFFSGIGLSTILTGILFRLQHWPGGNFQLMIGLIFSGIIMILLILKYIKGKELFYKEILIRFVIIGFFGLILFYTTDYSIDKIRYRNYPDYVKALDDLQQNPQSEELRKKADYEYNKIIFTEEELEYMNIKEN